MGNTAIGSLRRRPLLIIGDAARQIRATADGVISSRVGGLGYDVAAGVCRACGAGRAVLLTSPDIHANLPKGARHLSTRAVASSGEFELVLSNAGLGLSTARGPSRKQLDELREILDEEEAAARASHLHVAGFAALAWLATCNKERSGMSASVRCSDVSGMTNHELRRLPGLLFLDGDCDDLSDSCPALATVGDGRVLVHQGSSGVTSVIVDAVENLSFGVSSEKRLRDAHDSLGGLAGATLVGIAAGLCLEEAVASGLLLRDRSGQAALPAKVGSMSDDVRASRIFALMDSGRCGRGATSARSAVGVLVIRGRRLLVGSKRAEKAFMPGRLYLPGGKLEPGEGVLGAAQRELLEETGLSAQRLAVCGYSCYRDKGELYRFAQLLATADGDPRAADDLETLAWRDVDEIQRDEVFSLTWTQLHLLREYGLFDRLGHEHGQGLAESQHSASAGIVEAWLTPSQG